MRKPRNQYLKKHSSGSGNSSGKLDHLMVGSALTLHSNHRHGSPLIFKSIISQT